MRLVEKFSFNSIYTKIISHKKFLHKNFLHKNLLDEIKANYGILQVLFSISMLDNSIYR